ncbi:phytanoyl-CoA dioxygenase family protein [Niabella ginsengisoli]|uniref:Phytanoyl-CoA dioxygenase family protein n=1 Tax=Niabella ginsengisoli TaxID=522298 RepID=A0ABS9SDT0_9BACT|nr:phytanoyl-CoA dioxygenase family protein [Niabella ginsengisoli]MCH5596508.1 phytanoyl-CoA dioxygenase family protein [Niabella ginsengisoli]
MEELQMYRNEISELGFSIIENIYSPCEIEKIIGCIDQAALSNRETFRKSSDLFAIRQFLKEVPSVQPLVFNNKLKEIIQELFGKDYFVVKSIYFDKPETSNWYVSYHQDLTISVDKKIDREDFGPWTTKQNQFAVQPPINILKSNFTIRIHLDETDENNGALKVIEKSHLKGIYRPETIDWAIETEKVCKVAKGGIMIMKPLTLHGSNRTTNKQRRRVIHIEFSNAKLPEGLNWSEKLNISIA